jgi:hypothetical protein
MTVGVQLQKEKNNSCHKPQEAWHEDELIGGKLTVVK